MPTGTGIPRGAISHVLTRIRGLSPKNLATLVGDSATKSYAEVDK